MAPFDYIAVLLSMVISLALAHILTGIATIIQFGIKRLSIPLINWVGFCIFLCIDYWFFIWQIHEQTVWPFLYVSLLLTQAALIFIIAKIIVPMSTAKKPIDMIDFYNQNRRKFMGVALFALAVNQVTNYTLPGFHALPLPVIFIATSWAIILGLGWLYKSNKVQLTLVAANIMLCIYYVVTFIPAL